MALPQRIVNTFTYNGDGQRVQKDDSSGTTKHVWDRQSIVLDTDDANSVNAAYSLEPAVYGAVLSQSRSAVTSFYSFDATGCTRNLTNMAGLVTDSYAYDSFGNPIRAGSTANPYTYVGTFGYYLDPNLPAYFVRRRTLSATLGRFLSAEAVPSIGPVFGNRYGIANNDPANYFDPSGGQSVPVKQPTKCTVSVVCVRLVFGAIHCGVEISDGEGDTVFHISGPSAGLLPFPALCTFGKGRPSIVGVNNPNWWTQRIYVGHQLPDDACECIRATAAIINSKNNIYSPVPANSQCGRALRATATMRQSACSGIAASTTTCLVCGGEMQVF